MGSKAACERQLPMRFYFLILFLFVSTKCKILSESEKMFKKIFSGVTCTRCPPVTRSLWEARPWLGLPLPSVLLSAWAGGEAGSCLSSEASHLGPFLSSAAFRATAALF